MKPAVTIAILGVVCPVLFRVFGSESVVGTIHTTSGKIQGHPASGISAVSEYLGIPYAKPPVGALRWAPPEPYNASSNTDIFDASQFGNSCPQTPSISTSTDFYSTPGLDVTPQGAEILLSMLGQPGAIFSEDCLTLNIWAKAQPSNEKRAVLLWIHGGGYNTGTTNNSAYNGKYIADQEDVIVVSVNYRLNIFGFPGNPNTRNNLGLLDQRLAVEWVRDNIEAFGGDPTRITLFGESAGGSSVDYYTFAWTSDPIVSGFIAESGNVFSPNSQASASQSAKTWYNVTGNLGCGDASTNPDDLLDCMRSKDWQDVRKAISTGSGTSSVTGSFGPTIDEIVVFSDYPVRAAAGNFIQKPLMIGSNDYEVGLFEVLFALQGTSYPKSLYDFLQLAIFTCATASRALATASHKIPTWRYRWFGNFPNTRISTIPDSGAWHGSEIPIIFGTDMDIQNVTERTLAETEIITYMRGAWAAFAKDPVMGLTKSPYQFPQYSTLTASLLQLAYNNQTGPNAVFPSKYDWSCPVATVVADALSILGIF